MMDTISDCLDEYNRKMHQCHTRKGSKKCLRCGENFTPPSQVYNHCQECIQVISKELKEKYMDNNLLAKQRRLEDF